MNAIVDVQGFKTETNEFIIKEIAILCDKKVQVFLIKPPYPFYDLTKKERLQVSWIERHRKIYWNEGEVLYSKHKTLIANILRDKNIYVKGSEKTEWLKIFTNYDVNNLEDKGCPSLLSLQKQYENCNDLYSCIYHNSVCALKNVICLNKWCIENKFFK